MVERPIGSISGDDKPTPEEQLLRLIETPEEKPPAEEASSVPRARRKAGVSLKGLARYFSPARFSLKVINRLLLILALVLSLYLVLVISPISGFGLTRLSYQEQFDNFLKQIKHPPWHSVELSPRGDPIEKYERIDIMTHRNVFLPIFPPEEAKPKEKKEPEKSEQPKAKEQPMTVTDSELDELKKSFKLLATVCESREPLIMKAFIEDTNGNFFYRGKGDSPIEGTAQISGKRIPYRLRVQGVKDDGVILIEDSKERPREMRLEIYNGK